MNLNALARKAAKGPAPAAYGGAMEVEDMIRCVLFHGAAAADEIERLAKQHEWVMDGLLPDGGRVVPFGRWALVCIAYGRASVAGLLPLLRDPAMASFAVGVLAEVRTPASVEALIDYCATARFTAEHFDQPDWTEWEAVRALVLLMAFDDFVPVPMTTLDRLRDVLIGAYEKAATPPLRANALSALRGAPGEATLAWVKGLKNLDLQTAQAQKACLKALQKRMAADFKPLTAEQKRQIRKQRAANV